MSIEYSKIDMDVRIQYENEPKYGLHEVTDTKSGETHSTVWDAATNTRTSRDIDSDFNVSGEHSTNQNYPKGHPDRH